MKDKRKEEAMLGNTDTGPTWVEETDPQSGAKLWRNKITDEISIEDPTGRPKSES